jgi:hypothetical protein
VLLTVAYSLLPTYGRSRTQAIFLPRSLLSCRIRGTHLLLSSSSCHCRMLSFRGASFPQFRMTELAVLRLKGYAHDAAVSFVNFHHLSSSGAAFRRSGYGRYTGNPRRCCRAPIQDSSSQHTSLLCCYRTDSFLFLGFFSRLVYFSFHFLS